MRLQDGKFIKYNSNPVFITDGVDVRVTDTHNGDKFLEKNRLLRKFEFISQDEMFEFVRANRSIGEDDGARLKLIARWKKENEALGYDGLRHRPYGVQRKGWTFGKDKESNTSTKTDKLLAQGRSTEAVRKIMRETLKSIRLSGLDKMLNERFESVKRKRVWCEDGSELDIDRIMTGDPDHWIKTKRNGKKRVVRIGINVSMSCMNSSDTFAKNVALAYITAEALENLGYGVEIVALDVSWYCGGNKASTKDEVATTFPLKRVTEPVDIDRVGSIGLPSMLRHYGFITHSLIHRQLTGWCKEASDEMKGFMNIDILVSTSFSRGNSDRQARTISRVINETINK